MGSTWGDHFSSSSKHQVGRHLNLIMKFISILCFVASSQAFVVRREAEADAEADAFGIGYGASPRAVSAPVCKSVPQKVCKDRTIETPRKVCHTEHDEIVDTTVTEHCQTTTTTKCEQTSSQTRHSSNIVGSDSKVVSSGVVASPEVTVAQGASTHGGVVSGYTAGTSGAAVGYGAGGAITSTGVIGTTGLIGSTGVVTNGASLGYGGVTYAKREADADAEADAGFYGYGSNGVSPVSTSAPICRSVPVRTCNKVPVNRPRKVAKTVCKTVTDIKVIKDCTDTVSTTCTQQSVQQSHSSAVVGSDSKVGPSAVVANHGTVSVGNAGGYGTGAVVGGYSSGSLLGAVSGGYTGGVVATGYAAPVVSGVSTSGAATAVAGAAATGCVNSTGQSVPCSA